MKQIFFILLSSIITTIIVKIMDCKYIFLTKYLVQLVELFPPKRKVHRKAHYKNINKVYKTSSSL